MDLIDISNLANNYGWAPGTVLEVYINRSYDGNPDATIKLSNKLSDRLTMTVP